MKYFVYLFFFTITFFGCQSADERDFQVPLETTLFGEGQPIATIRDKALQEASGLAVSRVNPDFLWTHNDSGDDARLYLMNLTGEVVMTVLLENTTAVDWEEMSIQTIDSIHYLLIGDIGDNEAKRNRITLHRIKEPRYNNQAQVIISSNEIESMTLQYAEGPRDAESFFYDEIDQEIVLITKREKEVNVYSFSFSGEDKIVTIKSQGTIPWRNFTSADVLSNGDILIKNYASIFYWIRSGTATQTILHQSPRRIPYIVEPQGEALAVGPKNGFYTLSEKNEHADQQLFYYKHLD